MIDYSRIYYTVEEILNSIGNRISGLQINKIESAYDFSDKALESVIIFNTPVFFHSTRVCKSLVSEFEIFNPEMLISSLIADVYKSNEEISDNILTLNFGPYVTFITELMSEQDEYGLIEVEKLVSDFDNAHVNLNDFLTIWLAKHLDYIRCIDFLVMPELTSYIFNFNKIIDSIEHVTNSAVINKILKKIKTERNKLLC